MPEPFQNDELYIFFEKVKKFEITLIDPWGPRGQLLHLPQAPRDSRDPGGQSLGLPGC